MLHLAVQNPFQTSMAEDVLAIPYGEMLINMALAVALGAVLAAVYRGTHKGLSYSQSFTQTILFVTLIVAIVMMVIGSNVARAFALVGALSIIRFRTVVKDTKDTAFVFAALSVGMAAGTSNYALALLGGAFVVALALVLYGTNFGALHKTEVILRFTFDQGFDSAAYLRIIQEQSRRANLLHLEPSGDGRLLRLTYYVTLEKDVRPERITTAMGEVEGVSEVVLIAAKSDIDY